MSQRITLSFLPHFFGLLLITLLLSSCQESQPLQENVRAIKIMTVNQLASGQLRNFSGIVHAADSAALSFEVSGQVQSIQVDIGAQVEQGTVLAKLDPESYELDVQAAEAELLKAKADRTHKEAEYVREEAIYREGAGSKRRLDSARYGLETARSQVEYAQARLNIARRDLRKTVLTAPFAGSISERLLDPNEEVKAGQKVFELDAAGALEVWADVPETTVARLVKGSQASVRFPARSDYVIDARISEIGSAASRANAFPVKVELLTLPESINPGMTAEITFTLKGNDENLSGYLVPLQALLAGGPEYKQPFAFVFDADSSTVVKTSVQIRGIQDNMAIVYQGLEAGDRIAIAGVSFLSDGLKVKLMPTVSN